MANDIDAVISSVRELVPDVLIQQLAVSHLADDDGLWFFRLPGMDQEIQVESSTYDCPFLIEYDDMRGWSGAAHCHTVDDTVATVIRFLKPTEDR